MANPVLSKQTQEEALEQFFEAIKDDMLRVMTREGMDASGATRRSFRVEVNGNKGVLYGPSHIQVLESGRGPTQSSSRSESGQSLVDIIERWIIDKGISIEGNIRSAAWAIATVIHREGTGLFRDNKQSGILSDTLTQSRFDAFFDTFSRTAINEVFSNVIKEFPKQ